MAVGTAEGSSVIRVRKPEQFRSEIQADVEALPNPERRPSDTHLGAVIGPVPMVANWFPVVERRIAASISRSEPSEGPEGTWLSLGVAVQAIRFFQATSDVLPDEEPYLYASLEGDLVAEFKAPHGKMTNVVGKGSVLSFAVKEDGTILKTRLELPVSNVRRVRHELRQLTERLYSRRHAIVES